MGLRARRRPSAAEPEVVLVDFFVRGLEALGHGLFEVGDALLVSPCAVRGLVELLLQLVAGLAPGFVVGEDLASEFGHPSVFWRSFWASSGGDFQRDRRGRRDQKEVRGGGDVEGRRHIATATRAKIAQRYLVFMGFVL